MASRFATRRFLFDGGRTGVLTFFCLLMFERQSTSSTFSSEGHEEYCSSNALSRHPSGALGSALVGLDNPEARDTMLGALLDKHALLDRPGTNRIIFVAVRI